MTHSTVCYKGGGRGDKFCCKARLATRHVVKWNFFLDMPFEMSVRILVACAKNVGDFRVPVREEFEWRRRTRTGAGHSTVTCSFRGVSWTETTSLSVSKMLFLIFEGEYTQDRMHTSHMWLRYSGFRICKIGKLDKWGNGPAVSERLTLYSPQRVEMRWHVSKNQTRS
jgi:hypothetical protein